MSELPDLLPTRRSLLSRLKDWGDHQSWKEFFDSYWKLIYRAARRAGLTDAEAQDVVQETVLAFARKAPEFRYDPDKASFKGFLLRLTSWRVAEQLARRLRQGGLPQGRDPQREQLQVADPAGVELENLWDQEWERHLVETATGRVKRAVKAKHYQIFDLCVAKGMPVPAVAKAMNVSRGQVYLVKYRISRMIQKEIANLQQQVGQVPGKAR